MLDAGFLLGKYSSSLNDDLYKVWPDITIEKQQSIDNIYEYAPFVQGFVNTQDQGSSDDIIVVNYNWVINSPSDRALIETEIKKWTNVLGIRNYFYN